MSARLNTNFVCALAWVHQSHRACSPGEENISTFLDFIYGVYQSILLKAIYEGKLIFKVWENSVHICLSC